ncbi:DUF6489 family protein [Sphingomonas jatrophae]|uniref:Uncharacterized protein n=1 Tax=Sphingomonas jatrophae TaxID=1166337 RepID=A0A1I6LP07_9SPHN|nr:DUF6489 family protein [Sphingomonas jatrophae]SFS04992.1 hypothetical protein SAMN05192580_3031 [Sphingomonas jatrophae]
MKVSVDIDCTPEEARRFLGLPDLTPVHAIYVDKLSRVAAEGVTPDVVEQMMKSWAPMGEAGMSMWRQLFDQMGNPRKA